MGHSEPGQAVMRYLTVQDMLWVNLQVTKKVNHFNYARLEEAVFYQYGYGGSRDLLKQAAQFGGGFVKLHPFAAGNEASAFVGVATFLAINGMRLKVEDLDAVAWFEKVSEGGPAAVEAVRASAEEDPGYHQELAPDIEGTVAAVLSRYASAVASLASTK